jgi:hypothetical protein
MNSQSPSISSVTKSGQYGGALTYKHPDYVERNTDKELLDALKLGHYCCVLNSSQTGKTSLMVQILNDLKKEYFICASIDLTVCLSTKCTIDQFYLSFANNLIERLQKDNQILLNFNLNNWWQEQTRSGFSTFNCLKNFIADIVLKETSGNLVIFVDEINSISGFEFRSDFFRLIRSFYNYRPMIDDYNRLTFALFGIATPSALCPDQSNSPFNVGKNIELKPFQFHEIKPLKEKLIREANYSEVKAQEAMGEILSFTNGHPYLTHCLCNLVVEKKANPDSNISQLVEIAQLVEEKIIKDWGNFGSGEPFTTIRKNLSKFNKRTADLLGLYKKILLSSQEVPLSSCYAVRANNSDMLQNDLKIWGLVLEENHILKTYCKIYEEIFNLKWIEVQERNITFYKEDYDNYHNADERQKQLYLLTGKILERTLKWAHENANIVKHLENKFFEESRQFWDKVQKAFPNQHEDKWETIVQAINNLTGGFDQFNDIIFNIAKTNEVVDFPQNDIQDWLEKNLVLSNLNLFEEYDQFKKDRDQFLNQEDASIDSFSLISTFKQIAQKEPILFDKNNPQHRKLEAMCFIITDKEHNLRILNTIYEKLMNQDWIKGVMEKICPYTKAFRDWEASGRQAHFLRNNDLKLALQWLGKNPTPILEVLEIEFVITSLVSEVWETPSVQLEATQLIIDFRPSLQGKNNYSDFLLRGILQWTKSQTPALEKLLGWVNESEISVENNRKWLESLIGSHIKNWSCQKLFDFSLALHSSQKEKDREIFISFDEYLGINKPEKVISKEILKKYEKILDKDQESNNNNFQKLVLTFLKRKIARISLMSKEQPEQERLDVLLDEIVTGSKGHLKSILIFNLGNGMPLYHNRKLKSDDPDLYHALFAEGGDASMGEAIEGFESLSEIQEALDSFGDVTKFGNLIYSIFKLKEGTMMVYFLKLTTPFAICFIAPHKINLGLVVTRSEAKIKDIKNELEDLNF